MHDEIIVRQIKKPGPRNKLLPKAHSARSSEVIEEITAKLEDMLGNSDGVAVRVSAR